MSALLQGCVLLFLQLSEFDTALRDGLTALQNGNLPTAADRLQSAIGLKQDAGIAWAALAQVRLRLGQPMQADAAAIEAERVGSQQPAVLRALLIYWSGRGSTEAIIRVAQRALRQDDRSDLHHLLGNAYLASKRTEEAVAELAKAAGMEPVQEKYVFDLGQALLTLERFDEAAKVFEDSLKKVPESAQLQLALGVARYGQRRFPEAITAFLRTIDLQPDVRQPYAFLGKILDHAQDRLPDIERRVAAFLKLHEDDAAIHLVYAKVLLRTAVPDLEKAEVHLRRAIALDPRMWESTFELGVLLVRRHQYGEAAVALATAARLNPDEPSCHYHLARLYDRLGKTEEAVKEHAIHERLVKNTSRRVE